MTPAPTSRALTRVTPVVPQRVAENADFPLQRSGLDVRELFHAPDHVVVRSRTPAAALELGLEQARGSMVKNQPAEALAALDEVWSGARHTETGWYLRGGSLALLGLPGEASRVVTEGLLANPRSAANHFLQSLARLSLGDLAAAQLSLANAATDRAPDALLLIQRALLSAQSGDVAQAEELLRRAAVNWPDHPALTYGRDMMREVLRNRTRDKQRTPNASRTPVSVEAFLDDDVLDVSINANRVRNAVGDGDEAPRKTSHDALTDALNELGQQLATGTKRQALTEVRTMLGSLSAGGTLATSMPASRAHATRAMLGAILDSLSTTSKAPGPGWEAESVDGHWRRSTPEWSSRVEMNDANICGNDVLLDTVRVLVGALRDGRPAEAEQELRRARGSIGDTTNQLLRAILGSDGPATNETFCAQPGVDQAAAYIRNGAPGHALLAPLRLGLALLPDSELSGHDLRTRIDADATVTYAASMGASSPGASWLDMRGVDHRPGSLVAAVGLLALSVLTFSASLPAVAIACAGAGVWLALRRGSRAP